MTFTKLLPGFQGLGIFEVEYLKNGASYTDTVTIVVIGNHT